MSKNLVIAAFTIATALTGPAFAQQGAGPVAAACSADIAKLCAGKSHEGREVRTCLETNKAKVSVACKAALESTGGGQGKGVGKAKN